MCIMVKIGGSKKRKLSKKIRGFYENMGKFIIFLEIGEKCNMHRWDGRLWMAGYQELPPSNASPPDDSPLGASSSIFERTTWRSTVINPISISTEHYFHQSIFYLRNRHFYQYNALTRILCMNPISISVKKASFLSTEHLLRNNSLHESNFISV